MSRRSGGWDEEQQQQFHERRFKAQDFRVINLKGADVGIMAVVVTPECLKVNQLFLLPEYQNMGIGRECMSLVLDEAHQLGKPVHLQVLKVNLRAQAFFRKLGFEAIDESDTHIVMQIDDWLSP